MDIVFPERDAEAVLADETPIQSAKASAKDPLPVVLRAALTHVERADKAEKSATDHRTSAGLRFKELKDRVQAGEAGKVSWADYCAKYVPTMTQWTVDRYIAIAEGKAPNDSKSANMGSGSSDWTDPYDFWRKTTGKEDNAKTRAEWDDIGKTPEPSEAEKAERADAEHKARQARRRNPEARKAQNAKAQAKRRAKSSTIREANGGKASKPRMDRETSEQYSRLAMMAKVLDAGQLQIINEIIEERWPGTEEKAVKAKAQRDASPAQAQT